MHFSSLLALKLVPRMWRLKLSKCRERDRFVGKSPLRDCLDNRTLGDIVTYVCEMIHCVHACKRQGQQGRHLSEYPDISVQRLYMYKYRGCAIEYCTLLLQREYFYKQIWTLDFTGFAIPGPYIFILHCLTGRDRAGLRLPLIPLAISFK